jgi:hypothetical protein
MEHRQRTEFRTRSFVPASFVREAAAAAPVGDVVNATPPEPSVELVREDGVVRAIDVTCACGQKIRLRCVYDA